jgi:uncharacterized membrane protein
MVVLTHATGARQAIRFKITFDHQQQNRRRQLRTRFASHLTALFSVCSASLPQSTVGVFSSAIFCGVSSSLHSAVRVASLFAW